MNLFNNVLGLLKTHEHLRDDDEKLWCNLIWEKLNKNNFTDEQLRGAKKLLELIADHKLPKYSTMTRVRRKIQSVYVQLRGKKYEQRQNSQKVWKKRMKSAEGWKKDGAFIGDNRYL